MSRIIVGLASLVLVSAVTSTYADDLQAFEAKRQAAVQKIKADVKESIDRSRKLDAMDARHLLLRMLREVKDSRDLLEADRTPLVQSIQVRINQLDENARAKKIVQEQQPLREPPIRTKSPVDAGDSGVAKRASDFIVPGKTAAQLHSELIRDREKNLLAIKNGIETSAVPTDKEIAFAKDWKERRERLQSFINPKLTKQETALLKTLNSVMSVDYNGDKFKAVLSHLQERTGLVLIMDEASVRDLNLDYDDPVTFKVQKATVRTILKKVLGDKGLTYIIKEGNIQVMTPKRASEYTVVRSYPVDDLIAPNQMQLMFGPFAGQAAMMQNAQMLINMIQMTIEPSYWQPNGPGSIVFYPPTRTLLIRASAEMHYQMSSPGMFGR